MKKHYCVDCKKEVSTKNTKRCQKCYGLSITKHNYCIDCGIKTHPQAKRCAKCAGRIHSLKMKGKPKTDGCSLKKYFCEICNYPIGWQAYVYGTKKCKKCSHTKHDENTLIKFCIDCGKKLNKSAYYLKTKRCNSCARKYAIKIGTFKIKIGKDHWHYKDGRGYAPYPSEFNDSLKESIRNRDNYECQNCSMTEEEHLIKYNRVLDIHHKDHNKENCSKSNLITLCKKCNLKQERI